MTKQELQLWLQDEFHDWIDGDDSVQAYWYDERIDEILVVFASGLFSIKVKQL